MYGSMFPQQNIDMENLNAMMGQTLNNLGNLLKSGGSKHMCMLIAFVVVVFFILYYIIS